MIIYKIIRKAYPKWVRRIKTSDLDLNLCSLKFKNSVMIGTPPTEVFVKCNEDGSFDLRPRKKGHQEYRLYDIMKHEEIIETKTIKND